MHMTQIHMIVGDWFTDEHGVKTRFVRAAEMNAATCAIEIRHRLRARASPELGITYETVDEVAGFPSRATPASCSLSRRCAI